MLAGLDDPSLWVILDAHKEVSHSLKPDPGRATWKMAKGAYEGCWCEEIIACGTSFPNTGDILLESA